MKYEALDAVNLTKSHAKWTRLPLHRGKSLELNCTARIGEAKAATDTRELRTGRRREVLSEAFLGVMRGYRWA